MARVVVALALSVGAASAFLHGPARSPVRSLPTTMMSKWGPDWELKPESVCIHGGWAPDPATTSRAVPIYRTAPYQFESTEKAAKLFALAELGNIYSRLMNPTVDVLEKRMAILQNGVSELGGLGVASGTNAVFYAIINLAQVGDNIVSARNLYGGTYTQFKDILPPLGITVKFVDSNDPAAFAAAADDKVRAGPSHSPTPARATGQNTFRSIDSRLHRTLVRIATPPRVWGVDPKGGRGGIWQRRAGWRCDAGCCSSPARLLCPLDSPARA